VSTSQADFLAALASHSLAGFYVIQDGLFRYVNPAFTRLFGYSQEELVDRLGPQDLIVPEHQARIEDTRQRLLQGSEDSLHYELRARTKAGAELDVELLVVQTPYQGRPAVMGTVLDVTVRKRAEGEAEERRLEIEALYRASSRLLRSFELEALAKEIVDVAAEELGHGDATLMLAGDISLRRVASSLQALGPLVLPLDGPGLTVLAANTGEIVSVPDVTRHSGYVSTRATPGSELAIPLTVGERVLGVLDFESTSKGAFSGRDVLLLKAFADRAALAIDKAQLHERLRERTRQLERFHELAVLMTGNPTEVYDAIARQIAELLATPYAGVVGIEGDHIRGLAVVGPDGDRAGDTFPIEVTPLREVRDARESRVFHDVARRFPDDPYLQARGIQTSVAVPVFDRKGDVVGFLNALDHRHRDFGPDDARILGLLARRAGEEMEEERRQEEIRASTQRLAHSERMASLGEVVAGVAHELNNPLGSVLGLAELLSRRDDLSEGVRASVEKIAAEADRARKVVRNLLAFARQQEPQRDAVQVGDVVASALALREHDLAVAGIDVVREIAAGLKPVLADPHQLQQAFLNLVLNAEHARRDAHGRGRLTVRASSLPAGGQVCAGPAIRIEFEDDGPGIPPENRHRIFEPFFTTKAVGTGTGLGLSLTHGIVEQQGGAIWAERGASGGARFVVELPTGQEDPQNTVGEAPLGVAAALLVGRRVLFLEDEEALREIGCEVLEAEGCQVVPVGNGQDALVRLAEETFDVVVSDVKMPGLSGLEVYRRACALHSGLARRFHFVTGDVVRPETARFLEETGCAHLEKPYNVDQLVRCVAEVLEAADNRSRSSG
jgi:PAS domain S-box-containing protein